MGRLTPVRAETLIRVFERLGYRRDGVRGSHLRMTRPGSPRPIIVPLYREVPVFIIQSNLRTSGISREDFLRMPEEERK